MDSTEGESGGGGGGGGGGKGSGDGEREVDGGGEGGGKGGGDGVPKMFVIAFHILFECLISFFGAKTITVKSIYM